MKVGSKWKCVGCGQIMTTKESLQNSLELSDVMRSAIDNKRTLNESLDEMLGRKEWEELRGQIPVKKKLSESDGSKVSRRT